MVNVWILILITCLFTPFVILAQEGDSLLVRGKIASDKEDTNRQVALSFIDAEGKSHNYSSYLRSDSFQIQVPVQKYVIDATFRVLTDNYSDLATKPPLNIFIHNEDINVEGQTDELDLAIVSGGAENDDYNVLRQSTAGLSRRMAALYAPIMKGETIGLEKPEEIFEKVALLSKQQSDTQKQFILAHPHSYVSLFLLYRMKSMFTADAYAEAFKSLDTSFRKTAIGVKIQKTIDKESVTARGVTAINFGRTTAEGEPFKLSDLKGRVFLLDFWGSWCGPCKASMPHLKELYERYKTKGFEIVGVAHEREKVLDESRMTWLKAIDELGIHWTNVLNNENKDQFDIVKAYNISAFPTKILVDANGKIILRVSASATDDIDVALKKIYGF